MFEPIAWASTGNNNFKRVISFAFAACNWFKGRGRLEGSIPEWHKGITGISLIQPHPASKFIQGRLIDSGLHKIISMLQFFKASVISLSHFWPKAILCSSDEIKTSINPRNAVSINSLT